MHHIFILLLAGSLLTGLELNRAIVQREPVSRAPAYQTETGVVAVIAPDREITIEELDRSVGRQIQTLKEKMFALRRTALDGLINRSLLEVAARKEGITLERLRQRLSESEPEISEAQIERTYSENLQTFSALAEDEAREKIRLDLENQVRLRAYRARVAALRESASIRIFLKEPEPERIDIRSGGHSIGDAAAPITIYEYSDFQCPYCRQAAATVRRVLATYPGKVRLIYKHFPLTIHPFAFVAGQAAFCAGEQRAFERFHDRLFEESDLAGDRLVKLAGELGLETTQFKSCLASDASRKAVQGDLQEAQRLGFGGTPTFVINGRPLRGSIAFEEFKRVIDSELSARGKED